MKSDPLPLLAAWLLLGLLPAAAQEAPPRQVSVAALTLPDPAGGLVHWRDGETATQELQLSTRYFSPPVKVKGSVLQFFDTPVAAGMTGPEAPEPLLTLTLPAASKLAFLVLRTTRDEAGNTRWRGSILDGDDWRTGTLRVYNSGTEPLGLIAGEKKIGLAAGKSADFEARTWDEPFPAKIYRSEPDVRLVFSSTWRVAPARRELCFLSNTNGKITLRSLLVLGKVEAEEEE